MSAVFEHLFSTYRDAERLHPDLMEPYAQAITDAEDREAMAGVMRHALAATFRSREGTPEFWADIDAQRIAQTEAHSA